MAAVSNYRQQPRGPRRLIYSGALGGAVRERTPSVPLCSLTMLNGLRPLMRGCKSFPEAARLFFSSQSFIFVSPLGLARDRNASRSATIAPTRGGKKRNIYSSFSTSFPHTRGGSDYKCRRWPSTIPVYHGMGLIVCLTSCEAAAASRLLTGQLLTITRPGGMI